MKLETKDYIVAADLIKKHLEDPDNSAQPTINIFIEFFQHYNSNFDIDQFLQYCDLSDKY